MLIEERNDKKCEVVFFHSGAKEKVSNLLGLAKFFLVASVQNAHRLQHKWCRPFYNPVFPNGR